MDRRRGRQGTGRRGQQVQVSLARHANPCAHERDRRRGQGHRRLQVRGVRDDEPRLEVVQRARGLDRGERRVERREHRAGLGCRREHRDVPQARPGPGHDHVAARDTQACQRMRGGAGLAVELCEGDGLVVPGDCHQVRVGSRGAGQCVTEQQHRDLRWQASAPRSAPRAGTRRPGWSRCMCRPWWWETNHPVGHMVSTSTSVKPSPASCDSNARAG